MGTSNGKVADDGDFSFGVKCPLTPPRVDLILDLKLIRGILIVRAEVSRDDSL